MERPVSEKNWSAPLSWITNPVCKSENPLSEAGWSGGVMECVMHQGISS